MMYSSSGSLEIMKITNFLTQTHDSLNLENYLVGAKTAKLFNLQLRFISVICLC